MYCPNCGKQIEENSKFCQNCGAQLPQPQQPPVQTPVQTAQPPAQPAPQKSGRRVLPLVLGILIGVIAAVAVCVAVFHFRGGNPPEPSADSTEPAAVSDAAGLTEDTAAQSDETTQAPADTAAAPEETTNAPEDTAAAPEETTQAPASTTAASEDMPAETLDALWDKLNGCWSTENSTNNFVMFSRENGKLRFVYGIWYSDILIDATATGKWTAEPDSDIVSVHIYSPEIDEEGYYSEEMDIDLQIDLTDYDHGRISWFLGREWESGTYAGATMEEAQPDW